MLIRNKETGEIGRLQDFAVMFGGKYLYKVTDIIPTMKVRLTDKYEIIQETRTKEEIEEKMEGYYCEKSSNWDELDMARYEILEWVLNK